MEIIFLGFENRGQEWIFYPRVEERESQEERIQSAFHFPVFHRLPANCSKFFILVSSEPSFTHYFYLLSHVARKDCEDNDPNFSRESSSWKIESIKRKLYGKFLIASN